MLKVVEKVGLKSKGCGMFTLVNYGKVSDVASREGNGTPLQYSCLKNPTDGEVW